MLFTCKNANVDKLSIDNSEQSNKNNYCQCRETVKYNHIHLSGCTLDACENLIMIGTHCAGIYLFTGCSSIPVFQKKITY